MTWSSSENSGKWNNLLSQASMSWTWHPTNSVPKMQVRWYLVEDTSGSTCRDRVRSTWGFAQSHLSNIQKGRFSPARRVRGRGDRSRLSSCFSRRFRRKWNILILWSFFWYVSYRNLISIGVTDWWKTRYFLRHGEFGVKVSISALSVGGAPRHNRVV